MREIEARKILMDHLGLSEKAKIDLVGRTQSGDETTWRYRVNSKGYEVKIKGGEIQVKKT